MTDFVAFHKSLSDELFALKNRIRDLSSHWPTDGEYKESALRTILRRHLPSTLEVGRGFIVSNDDTSNQLDILVVDRSMPVLFREGDLLFVTPECVRAAVEVKTKLATTSEIAACVAKLYRVRSICSGYSKPYLPWLGVFCYDETLKDGQLILQGVKRSVDQHGALINCLVYGKDLVVRRWHAGSNQGEDHPHSLVLNAMWRLYRVENLAVSWFIWDLLSVLSRPSGMSLFGSLFPYKDHERGHIAQIEDRININSE